MAIATLEKSGIAVSLVFQFNDVAEAVSVYTPTRLGRFEGAYQQMPWEGHFDNYQYTDGMYVPLYGAVGWYSNKVLQLVWKGHATNVQYQFER